ncbi:MAG: glycosyltransferase [Ruminococcus sp.]|nr:glycosyltransferase [Ruminococcus sp.]
MIYEDITKKNIVDEYPILDKDLKIAQIGFITPTKGQKLSVEVMKNLKDRGVDASLAIIGSVREGDDEFKAMLDKMILYYNLSDNIVFTGYRTDIDEIISSFDVLFVPSTIEGFSLASAQAIMQDVPVLSIDKTGCTEVVEKSRCGMVFSEDSSVKVVADTLIKTASLDVKKIKEKHPDFLLSECSETTFKKKTANAFIL